MAGMRHALRPNVGLSGDPYRSSSNARMTAHTLGVTLAGELLVRLGVEQRTLGLRRPSLQRVREQRYRSDADDPDGRIHADRLDFVALLDEPFYPLVRQQLLADRVQRDGVADAVRVVHVLSPVNVAYQHSLSRAAHRQFGGTVDEV
jgi:hypothetical protein